MRKMLFLFIILLTGLLNAQTLVKTILLPVNLFYNSAYGLCYVDGKLWISSGTTNAAFKNKLIAWDTLGNVVDSIYINYPTLKESQGLAWDGTDFWYSERLVNKHNFRKISTSGVVLDTINMTTFYMGGIAYDQGSLWFSVYYPNNRVGAYKLDLNSKLVVDSLPIYGLQPQGITIKGDTLFYVMENFEGDPEVIAAVSMTTRDTLFTFPLPLGGTSTMSPRGLAWDGRYLWMIARVVGNNTQRALYKFELGGEGTPQISVAPNNLEFGNVQLDSSGNSYTFIFNRGTGTLRIDSLKFSSEAFSSSAGLPLTIPAGGSVTFPFSFRPHEPGYYKDSVLIYHNDVNYPFTVVRLNGRGIFTGPVIAASSPELDYGNKRIRSTSFKDITISNIGSAPLMVDSLSFGSDYYYIQKPPAGFVIDSVGSMVFRVWSNPQYYGVQEDTLSFYSNAANGVRFKIPLSTNCVPQDSALGAIYWRGVVPNNPKTVSNDLSAKFIRKAGDLNGDGVADMLVGTDNYYTIAYNGNSSGTDDILWKFNSFRNNNDAGSVSRMGALQFVGDVNNDGIGDVCIGTAGGSEYVFMIDGATGAKLWEFGDSIDYDLGDINGIDGRRDWNNDGVIDILATASGNEFTYNGRFSVYCLDGKTGAVIWQINDAGTRKMKDAVVSFPGGGVVSQRVAGATAGELYAFNDNGAFLWSYPTSAGVWAMDALYDTIGGKWYIIAADVGGKVYSVDAATGTEVWQTQFLSAFAEDLAIIPDIDEDGFPDVMVQTLTPTMQIYSGKTGAVIRSFTTGHNNLDAGLLGDLNADGFPEVGIASLDNKIWVFSGKNPDVLFTYTFGPGLNAKAAEAIKAMDDIDRNGTLEFLVGSREGEVIAFSGGFDVPVSVKNPFSRLPEQFEIWQNYPNPFNPSTQIQFALPVASEVTLRVYDLLGSEVATIVNEQLPAGLHAVQWNGKNNRGEPVNSGIYFYTIKAGDFYTTRKMILLK
ncbi:MAG: choice-of-anchor D domain-containing protein [Ignavibacteriales bacterium]|nr:MAG: choice-of-anchor D domain-containing protein [Ignavibacteriaceae bacterium]MBW7872056.1 choice-of-anchor D domain-containing protein [Ignavibacteria bacterium]MCZ2143691.1 choice-of-anchor D domain-containing protein [Ignavibacteriales bacterium]OQY75452.1 MAG: hypothetical protein B6D45_05665 [Ignavibacteriales bacterium UTCHB3]MBV6446047.1 hypothetical protein [Ignavibacteriaceae bacterium]